MSRHAHRHRQPHADDQWHRRARLGRRRPRSRERDVRHAGDAARARGRRCALTGSLREGVLATDLALTVTRTFASFAAGRKIRGVLRPGRPDAVMRRARRRRQHGARVRRIVGLLSHRSADPRVSARDRAHAGFIFNSSRTTPDDSDCGSIRTLSRVTPKSSISISRVEIPSPALIGRRTGCRRGYSGGSRTGRRIDLLAGDRRIRGTLPEWRSRNRSHHQLHEHLRSSSGHRCGLAGQESARASG